MMLDEKNKPKIRVSKLRQTQSIRRLTDVSPGNNNTEQKVDDNYGGHGHDHHERGTAVELWRNAVTAHPEVVSQYGGFSSELLQTMLGIEVIVDKPRQNTVSGQPKCVIQESKPVEYPRSVLSKKDYKQRILAPASARNSNKQEEKNVPRLDNLSTKHEDRSVDFIAPKAVLLRNMRRCEKRLRPFQSKWHTADAVLTKYEIVFFHPTSFDQNDESFPNIDKRENVWRNIAATKGGKGMRLQDVALGRKVIGRIELCNISTVKVEKNMHRSEQVVKEESEIGHGDDEYDIERGCISRNNSSCKLCEYWTDDNEVHDLPDLSLRWDKVEEHNVKIKTSHGIQVFRFFSDLREAELHPQRQSQSAIKRNDAFLWCQTIVRLCGPNQLLQELPHYGDGDDRELRDYLEIVVDGRAGHGFFHRHDGQKSL